MNQDSGYNRIPAGAPMAVATELQNQWDAFLKLLQVREPRLHEHLKGARIKELTKYNMVVYAQNAEALKEIEVGLKVYHDKIGEFMPMIFGDNRGIKTELASEADWEGAAPPQAGPPASPMATVVSADQNELLRVLESSIRQKVESEIRSSLEAEASNPEVRKKITQKLKEDFEQEEENRRLAVRMALIAEGDKILTQLVMVWQQAKQDGDGGAQWNEVKQRLLELLDAAVQLTHS
jgi:ATP-dependent Lon protease